MKSITAGFATHLEGTTTTLATCWKVTRVNESPERVFGFTDHDRDLIVSGVTYRAATGYTRTAVQTAGSLAVDNLDLEGAFSDDAITASDVRAGLWDYAIVEMFVVNWADLTDGVIQLRKGRLGEVRTERSVFVAELRGLMQHLQQVVGRVYSPLCDADLGDSRCKVALGSYTVTGTVTAVTSRKQFTDSSRAEASGYFTRGKITWTSGPNTDLSMDVKSSSGATIILALPMPYDISAGHMYRMVAGCQKRMAADCRGKFNNLVNFRGFPHVPGVDKMASGGL